MNPNIVVMGVSHSGTSPLTEMLYRLGWRTQETNPHFRKRAETQWVKDYNGAIIKWQRGAPQNTFNDMQVLFEETVERVKNESQPWAIKDPRFVLTLHEWVRVFREAQVEPMLIALCRPKERLRSSFKRRSEQYTIDGVKQPGAYGKTIAQLVELMNNQFQIWPWVKLSVKYTAIRDAVQVFDTKREDIKNKNFGKAGF